MSGRLVSGHRSLATVDPFTCRAWELTDRQAAVAVETENTLRKETSPYERGLWLTKLLRRRLYRSQDEMARELAITARGGLGLRGAAAAGASTQRRGLENSQLTRRRRHGRGRHAGHRRRADSPGTRGTRGRGLSECLRLEI